MIFDSRGRVYICQCLLELLESWQCLVQDEQRNKRAMSRFMRVGHRVGVHAFQMAVLPQRVQRKGFYAESD